MIKPFQHQIDIWQEDRKWTGLFLGTGSFKTTISLGLATGRTLVIVEKQLRLERKFENELLMLEKSLDLTVMSKEEFRRDWQTLDRFDTVIVDEAHNFFGVLPDMQQRQLMQVPKMSEMHLSLVNFLEKHRPERLYLLTATPASKPMHVFAIAKLLGREWDYYRFRDTFYMQVQKGYKKFFIPKNTEALKKRLSENIKRLGYTGGLNDFFDVPEQLYKEVFLELSEEQKREMRRISAEVADPMAKRAMVRSLENGVLYTSALVMRNSKTDRIVRHTRHVPNEKIEKILQYAEEFPKMLIFADFIGQVESIELALKAKGYKVFALTGATKNRKEILDEAEQGDACIIVASAKISAGYEFKSCPVVVFASKSNRYLNYEQALGRVQRGDNIKVNLYISLMVKGGMDEACHKAIMEGNDFQEMIMSNNDEL